MAKRALKFFTSFLAKPGTIGSVTPSSPFLVKALLDRVDFAQGRVIVEFGPGTGVITDAIQKRLHPEAKCLAIEVMPNFVELLQERYRHDPRMIVVQGSAADVVDILAQQGLGQADAVVSGLPFTSLPEELRQAILSATAKALRPEGRLSMYQYSTFLVGRLKQHFADIHTRFTPLNIPPAFIFDCDHPQPHASHLR